MIKMVTHQKSHRGFTLIELMITLAIIGMLFMFGRFNYLRYQEQANLKIASAMLAAYAQEITSFQLKTGVYPNNDSEFSVFQNQFFFDPNKDPKFAKYFLVVPDLTKGVLYASPQKAHIYHSYAYMELKDFTIYICKNTESAYSTEGGECQKTITNTIVNQ